MKRGTPDHPKTHALARILNLEQWGAVGLLESLWHFSGRYSPRGDIGRWTDERIAAGIGWAGDPAALVSALTRSGWLDVHPSLRLVVHDWHDHADEATRKYLKRQKVTFLSKLKRLSRHVETCRDMSGPPLPLPLSKPEPEPIPEPEPDSQPGRTSSEPPARPPADRAEERAVRDELRRAADAAVTATGRPRDELIVECSMTPRRMSFRNEESVDSVPWMRTTIERLVALRLQANAAARAPAGNSGGRKPTAAETTVRSVQEIQREEAERRRE